jgi:hypothetical protein
MTMRKIIADIVFDCSAESGESCVRRLFTLPSSGDPVAQKGDIRCKLQAADIVKYHFGPLSPLGIFFQYRTERRKRGGSPFGGVFD